MDKVDIFRELGIYSYSFSKPYVDILIDIDGNPSCELERRIYRGTS
jgi:hypothetical protein